MESLNPRRSVLTVVEIQFSFSLLRLSNVQLVVLSTLFLHNAWSKIQYLMRLTALSMTLYLSFTNNLCYGQYCMFWYCMFFILKGQYLNTILMYFLTLFYATLYFCLTAFIYIDYIYLTALTTTNITHFLHKINKQIMYSVFNISLVTLHHISAVTFDKKINKICKWKSV